MKYMGSKRWMLGNGLGHLLVERARNADRFVDLFSGTAAVSWHLAENTNLPVLAVDLQTYSAILAKAVLGRTKKLSAARLSAQWIDQACMLRAAAPLWTQASAFNTLALEKDDVDKARAICNNANTVITRSYGGYYFSPVQALTADALLATLPIREPQRSACLATLIWAITRCVAAPGHTAQPFQPTSGALSYLREAWSKDLISACREVLPTISTRTARTRGKASVGDAVEFAHNEVKAGDLVFLDPPYSAAQYSRFYHVLETVARGSCGEVAGGGRYPPYAERPQSTFSLLGKANDAMTELMASLGAVGCSVVMTFPQHVCSNGIIGEDLITLARQWFEVDVTPVRTRHSTLGGNNTGRSARRSSVELILSLKPRNRRGLAKKLPLPGLPPR